VQDAVRLARKAFEDRVVLHIHGGKNWEALKPSAEHTKTELREEEGGKTAENVDVAQQNTGHAPPNILVPQDEIFGVPRDLVLPASIAVLAVVVIGLFTISRLSRD
jgi:hypothetical protein